MSNYDNDFNVREFQLVLCRPDISVDDPNTLVYKFPRTMTFDSGSRIRLTHASLKRSWSSDTTAVLIKCNIIEENNFLPGKHTSVLYAFPPTGVPDSLQTVQPSFEEWCDIDGPKDFDEISISFKNENGLPLGITDDEIFVILSVEKVEE